MRPWVGPRSAIRPRHSTAVADFQWTSLVAEPFCFNRADPPNQWLLFRRDVTESIQRERQFQWLLVFRQAVRCCSRRRCCVRCSGVGVVALGSTQQQDLGAAGRRPGAFFDDPACNRWSQHGAASMTCSSVWRWPGNRSGRLWMAWPMSCVHQSA